MSRASWLAAAAGSLVVFCPQISQICTNLKKRNKLLIIAGSLIAVCIVVAGLYRVKENSADGRFLMWKIGFQTAINNPFGAGSGHFSGAYGDAQAAYFANEQANETEELVAGSPEYGFNEYLQIAVENGFAGLLLFLLVIGFMMHNLLKNSQFGLLGSLVAFLVFAFFSYPFSVLPFLLIFVFLMAANSRKGVKNAKKTNFATFAISFASIAVSIFVLINQIIVFQAYKQWKPAQFLYSAGFYADAGEEYAKLYPRLNDRADFLFEYAHSLSNQIFENQKLEQQNRRDSATNEEAGMRLPVQRRINTLTKSNEILRRATLFSCDPMLYAVTGKNHQALKDYVQAEQCYLKAAHIVPHRLYPYYLLTKLYDEMGLKEKANETATIVLTKEPKVQSTAVREMREEVKRLTIRN
jgi:tetratricopeptide (TPR) repeat protein